MEKNLVISLDSNRIENILMLETDIPIKLDDINNQLINTIEPDLIVYDSPLFISKELVNFDLFDKITEGYTPVIIINCMRYFLSKMVILQNEKIYSLTKGDEGIIFNKLWLSVLPEINSNKNYISTAIKLLNHNLDYPLKIIPEILPEKQNKTINLIICMRNNEKYFEYFEKQMNELEKVYTVNFFIYENLKKKRCPTCKSLQTIKWVSNKIDNDLSLKIVDNCLQPVIKVPLDISCILTSQK
jgi:hypothetical protein